MKPSQFYEFTVQPWGAYTLTVTGDYFKIMRATGPVSIKAKWGELRELVAGQGLESADFDRLEVRNETGSVNVVRIFIGDRKFIDGMGGTVDIGLARAPQMELTQATVAVAGVSAQIAPARIGRQYLLIQNKDNGADVFLAFGDGPATVADGLRLLAGGVFELPFTVTTQAVHAIAMTGNPGVLVVEGV